VWHPSQLQNPIPASENVTKLNLRDLFIGSVCLGYVGQPLAFEFGKRFTTVGYGRL
jgi:hypothetical protein